MFDDGRKFSFYFFIIHDNDECVQKHHNHEFTIMILNETTQRDIPSEPQKNPLKSGWCQESVLIVFFNYDRKSRASWSCSAAIIREFHIETILRDAMKNKQPYFWTASLSW